MQIHIVCVLSYLDGQGRLIKIILFILSDLFGFVNPILVFAVFPGFAKKNRQLGRFF